MNVTNQCNAGRGMNAINSTLIERPMPVVWLEDEQTHQVIDYKIELREAVAGSRKPDKYIPIPA